MPSRQKVECIGGWSFFLLALGIFCLLPGTIMAGIYASRSDSKLRVVALVIFCISLSLFFSGIVMCLFWCKKTDSGKKRKPEGPLEKMGNNSNQPDYMNTPLTVRDLEVDETTFPGTSD